MLEDEPRKQAVHFSYGQREERHGFEPLMACERDMLRLVADGYRTPEIGEKLFISPETVDTYKRCVNEKLSLTHRASYVKPSLRLGLKAFASAAVPT